MTDKQMRIVNDWIDNDKIIYSKTRYSIIQKYINTIIFGDEYLNCKCNSNCDHYKSCFCSISDYKKYDKIFREKINH